jgi:spore coat protein U-like protein
MKLFKNIALLASLIGLLSLAAFAGNTTGTLSVTSTVSNACAVASGGAVAFGAYDPAVVNSSNGADLTQTGTFQMTCTSGATATVLMDQGKNPTGTSTLAVPARQMSDGATHLLGYQLYTTSARSTIWDGVTGIPETGTGSSQTIQVFGTVPKGQSVPANSYSDQVTITLSY